ncbi:HNH endonuclease [Myxococcus sp. AM011]|uniref:HNH endonuclease n=1 Tax=Myxococcus sp. AM011 TaxID=2745200 RepID=UPI00159635EC|nr:HNH endonuclease [Myxococcus sp. AM011]
MRRKLKPLDERFWSKVAKAHENDCWLWQAAISHTGYGVIGLGRQADGIGYSHRLAWALSNGPIPEGLYVLHRCDNRRCCNPSHLFLGTHAENMRDAARKGRLASQSQPERMVRGERHPNAKLNDTIVQTIRALRAGGRSYRQIARHLGIPKSNVAAVALGRTWRHVQ